MIYNIQSRTIKFCYLLAVRLVVPALTGGQASPARSWWLSRPPSGLCAFSNVWDQVRLSLGLYGTCWSSSPPT